MTKIKKILFVYKVARQKDIAAAIVSRHVDIVYFYDAGIVDIEQMGSHFGSS